MGHNNCSTKRAERILEPVKSDGETCRDCQESRDAITRGFVRDLDHYREQMKEVEEAIEAMIPSFHWHPDDHAGNRHSNGGKPAV